MLHNLVILLISLVKAFSVSDLTIRCIMGEQSKPHTTTYVGFVGFFVALLTMQNFSVLQILSYNGILGIAPRKFGGADFEYERRSYRLSQGLS